MEKDTINDLFDDLKGSFDIETPNAGHEQRFLEKLNAENENISNKSAFNWKPFLAIAASIVLCFTIFTQMQSGSEVLDLANVSPEMSEAQDFFNVTLQTELKKLDKERSPFTEEIINDALKQIDILDNEYNQLRLELTNQSKNERIIYAMISNFQSRIDILNDVLEHIETIKELKNETNENTNTI